MIEDDLKKILQIAGVEGYILVKQDGQIVACNAANAECLSAMIVMGGMGCENLRTEMGSSLIKHLVFTRKTKEKIIIIPLDGLFLGVTQKADAFTSEVINHIIGFIKGVKLNNRD
jgi:predicted regulator of Ras-like GTPase activity (Roadblock/LC7/MglB family)